MSEDLTPKEKAKELIIKLREANYYAEHEITKKLALICVNEIMHAIPANIDPLVFMPTLSYWKQVKDEIEKL